MRPTIGDIINGTKRIIQEVVFPFVAEHPNHPEQAAVMENLLSLMLLLEHAGQRWDKVHLFLGQENRALSAVVPGAARSTLHSTSDGSGDLSAEWEVNRQLKERLESVIKDLPASARGRVEAALNQLVAGERDWVKVGEVPWD